MSAPAIVTRTRQDLINSGDAFKMRRDTYSPSNGVGAGRNFRGGGSSISISNISNHSVNHNKSNSKRKLGECCYSISNLILIIASVIALFVLIQFVQDDPLYEYGEFLLSLSFYRKLIFALVLLPLILLIPLFNALAVFLLSNKHKHNQVGESILRLKLFYAIVMLVLAFTALIFVAPYIRATNLSAQIELELRKHMTYRYQNDFSYEFVDIIQEEYQCCDELWYRINLRDRVPTSCFVPGSNLSLIYDQTCSQALGWLISFRCSIIAACLVAILVALASLFLVDLLELLSLKSSRHNYKIASGNNLAEASQQQQQQRAGSFKRRNEDSAVTQFPADAREIVGDRMNEDKHAGDSDSFNDDDDQLDNEDLDYNEDRMNFNHRNTQHRLAAPHSLSSFDQRTNDNERATELKPILPLESQQSPAATTTTSYAIGSSNRLRDDERQHEAPLLLTGGVGGVGGGDYDEDDHDRARSRWQPTKMITKMTTKAPQPPRLTDYEKSYSNSGGGATGSGNNNTRDHDDDGNTGRKIEPSSSADDPIVLTRASYHLIQRDRSQSPVFKRTLIEDNSFAVDRTVVSSSHQTSSSSGGSSGKPAPPPTPPKPTTKLPIKSALKKTKSPSSSQLHIDRPPQSQPQPETSAKSSLSRRDFANGSADELNYLPGSNSYANNQQQQQQPRRPDLEISERDFDDTDADSLDEYAEKLRQSTSLIRQEPTRRSLLSVRFAE